MSGLQIPQIGLGRDFDDVVRTANRARRSAALLTNLSGWQAKRGVKIDLLRGSETIFETARNQRLGRLSIFPPKASENRDFKFSSAG